MLILQIAGRRSGKQASVDKGLGRLAGGDQESRARKRSSDRELDTHQVGYFLTLSLPRADASKDACQAHFD